MSKTRIFKATKTYIFEFPEDEDWDDESILNHIDECSSDYGVSFSPHEIEEVTDA